MSYVSKQKKQEMEEMGDMLKLQLTGKGWQTDHAEAVVDEIVEDLARNPRAKLDYALIANNVGVGTPPAFDDRDLALLEQIRLTGL